MKQEQCVNIICIETSTSLASVALSQNGNIKAYRESNTPKSHASLTTPFVKEVLDECGLTVAQCDGVCVSAGPGSYTGLRVGSSTAKGLCFGAGIPLFSMGTLDILASKGQEIGEYDYIVPMIDARRMEAYCAVFENGIQISNTSPLEIKEDSFLDILDRGSVLFIGDAAEKCSTIIKNANASFFQCCPSARSMVKRAYELYQQDKKENVAYFEPFYLKDFVATISKKNILGL